VRPLISTVSLYATASIISLSLIVDETLGEPPNRYHPVAWIGKLIGFLDIRLRKRIDSVSGGAAMAVLAIAVPVALVLIIQRISSVSIVIEVVVTALILKMTFASRSMGSHIIPVLRSMKEGDIEGARSLLSRTVRRDTSKLSPGLIYSACIETISEGYVDGFLSPVFYYGVFGLSGAVAARVINTLDSMVGYRDETYMRFGKFSALADTVMNYIPARISALVFSISSRSMGRRNLFQKVLMESSKTQSRNAGWPMASMAFLLGVRLEKEGSYVLNADGREPSAVDVIRALRIFQISVLIGAAMGFMLSVIIVQLILGYAGILP
jgi:adenosylcobinamide-phosphate synthase